MRGRRGDTGSVLLLTVALGAVALALVGVVVDAGRAFLDRRSLDALADGAALAGAQGVDLPAVYRDGVTRVLPLDPAAVRRDVAGYLGAAGAGGQFPDLHVDVVVGPTSVAVRLAATVTLPLAAGAIGTASVAAVSTAQQQVSGG